MATPLLFTHNDARALGAELTIAGEAHVVGEDLANFVMLNEIPKQETPSTVTIPGYTETTGTPGATQFRVFYGDYHAAYVEFNAAANGAAVAVSYKGRGSAKLSRDLNRIQNVLNSLSVSVAEFGAVPGASATRVRDGIQAAMDYVGALGGGTMFVPEGTYDWGAYTTHPYRSNARHCLDWKYDNVRLAILPGAHLRLANGQQVDGAPVDMIVFRERTNVTIDGGGKITANTAGQTGPSGWTGGYQQASGAGSIIHGFRNTGGFGVRNLVVRDLELSDTFSNPVDVVGDPAMPAANRILLQNIYSSGVGEGLEIQACREVRFINCTVEDPTNVMAGDGMECAACDDVIGIGNVARAVHADGGAGSAFDMYGSKRVLWAHFLVDGWSTGLGLSTTLDVSARTVDNARISTGTFRNVRANVLEAAEGQCMFENITVEDSVSTGAQFIGSAALPAVELKGCWFVRCGVGAQVRGSRRVNFDSCHFNDNVDDGLGVVRVAPGDDPVVSVRGGTMTGNGRYGFYADTQGDAAYKPTVVLDGVTIEDNITANIAGVMTNVGVHVRRKGMQSIHTLTLAAGTSTNIRNFFVGTSGAKPLGVATVTLSTGESAIFALQGDDNSVVKMAESNANLFVTASAADKVTVGYYPFTEGGTYRVGNDTADSLTITVSFVGQA